MTSAPLFVAGLCAAAACSTQAEPVASAIVAGDAVVASGGAATGRQQLSNHLTPEILRAPRAGRVPAAAPLELTIGLSVRNLPGLMAAVSGVSDPKSPDYRRFITPAEFADRFGVSAADYESVLAWVRGKNLSVTPHGGRLSVDVKGATADVEDALGVNMMYGRRPDGSLFYFPDREPSIDLAVSVAHIGNIETYDVAEPAIASGGSGTGGALQGSDLQKAYTSCGTSKGTPLTGAGQSIGIMMLDNFSTADVTAYFDSAGLTPPSLAVQAIPPGSAGNASAGNSPQGWAEGDLDVELALTLAPGAQIVAFTGMSVDTVLANMADNPSILQLVSGWAIPAIDAAGEASIAQLALQGQSLFVASGDDGAYPSSPSAYFGSANGTDLRQQPAVTVVGGTVLTLASGAYASETGWSFSSGPYLMGSGGGYVAYAAGAAPSDQLIPPYQSSFPNLATAANGASSTYRNYPDVSAVAENVNIYYGDPGTGQSAWPYAVAGTGIPAVIWASFLALANQYAAANWRQPVGVAGGFGALNPTLYTLAASAYATNFNDVMTGSNPESDPQTLAPVAGGASYTATAGYDLVTGLGSPKCGLAASLGETGACAGPASCTSGNVWNAALCACVSDCRPAACDGRCGTVENGCGATMNCGPCCTTPESCCEKTGGIWVNTRCIHT